MNEREAVHSPAAGRSKQDDGREGREREAASPRRILAFLLPPAAAAAASGGGGGRIQDWVEWGGGRTEEEEEETGKGVTRTSFFLFFFSSPSRRCGAAESTWPCGKVRFLRLVFPVTDHTHEMHASFSSAPPSDETEVNEANGGFHVRKGGASPPSG